MERSHPVENNKYRNLTLMKEEKENTAACHIWPVSKRRMDEKRGMKNRPCIFMFSCWVCFSTDASMRVGVFERLVQCYLRAYKCVSPMGSSKQRTIVPVLCANIDRQQVNQCRGQKKRKKKEEGIKRGHYPLSAFFRRENWRHSNRMHQWWDEDPKIEPPFKSRTQG